MWGGYVEYLESSVNNSVGNLTWVGGGGGGGAKLSNLGGKYLTF